MRQTYYFLSFVLLLFVFISCSNDVVGKGTDTIGLETKEVFFKSSKDSIELRTRKGDDWWLTEISTKDTIYSRSLKSAHLRDIVRKQYSADFFNKPQKNPHGSFEVVCSGS